MNNKKVLANITEQLSIIKNDKTIIL